MVLTGQKFKWRQDEALLHRSPPLMICALMNDNDSLQRSDWSVGGSLICVSLVSGMNNRLQSTAQHMLQWWCTPVRSEACVNTLSTVYSVLQRDEFLCNDWLNDSPKEKHWHCGSHIFKLNFEMVNYFVSSLFQCNLGLLWALPVCYNGIHFVLSI